MTGIPHDQAYIAKLWAHPRLCLALFGIQFHTPEGRHRYDEAGIQAELDLALAEAIQEGILLQNRAMETSEGPVLLQYWTSYDDLDNWARSLPHSRWWKWLLDNTGPELSFYHEIYQAKTAEAIFEKGCKPVGPAVFCDVMIAHGGEGRSKERQQRFAEAAALHSAPRD